MEKKMSNVISKWNLSFLLSFLNLQLPRVSKHSCVSIGKFASFISQEATIFTLQKTRNSEQYTKWPSPFKETRRSKNTWCNRVVGSEAYQERYTHDQRIPHEKSARHAKLARVTWDQRVLQELVCITRDQRESREASARNAKTSSRYVFVAQCTRYQIGRVLCRCFPSGLWYVQLKYISSLSFT